MECKNHKLNYSFLLIIGCISSSLCIETEFLGLAFWFYVKMAHYKSSSSKLASTFQYNRDVHNCQCMSTKHFLCQRKYCTHKNYKPIMCYENDKKKIRLKCWLKCMSPNVCSLRCSGESVYGLYTPPDTHTDSYGLSLTMSWLSFDLEWQVLPVLRYRAEIIYNFLILISAFKISPYIDIVIPCYI